MLPGQGADPGDSMDARSHARRRHCSSPNAAQTHETRSALLQGGRKGEEEKGLQKKGEYKRERKQDTSVSSGWIYVSCYCFYLLTLAPVMSQESGRGDGIPRLWRRLLRPSLKSGKPGPEPGRKLGNLGRGLDGELTFAADDETWR